MSLLRGMIGFAAQRLMEPDMGDVTGAAHGKRRPDRLDFPAAHRAKLLATDPIGRLIGAIKRRTDAVRLGMHGCTPRHCSSTSALRCSRQCHSRRMKIAASAIS
ncbi:hypothetical protein STAQ_45670 [Allostella sp. ATCC 35155]|nr:hypothetical protein STAQ_45670 [Stella sp. ATCC 35155]